MHRSEDEVVQLKAYTRKKLDELASRSDTLRDIADQLSDVTSTHVQPTTATLTDEEAEGMVKYSQNESIGKIFTDRQVLAIQDAVRAIVAMAMDADKDNLEYINSLIHCLHPLLSQDNRTEPLGYDMVESLIWHMSEPSLSDRQKNAAKLLHDWSLD